MRFAHIYQALLLEPWFIEPSHHAPIVHIVNQHKVGLGLAERATSFEALKLEDFVPDRKAFSVDSNGIATIPISGPIAKGTSKIERSCGVCDVNMISSQIDQARSQGASGFLLDVNSPGGTVTGVPELASKISNLEEPVVAFTDDLMASAAYYLSAGADKIVASPKSANVGSIGVYIPWVDYSEMIAEMGIKFDPIIGKHGDLKAIGATPALSEPHRAFLQERVDKLEEEFRGFVTSQRSVDPEGMRGQVLFGQDLLSTNLVDYLANYEDAYDTLLGLINQ